MAKKCQKEPKFGFPWRHITKPGEAGRSVVISNYHSSALILTAAFWQELSTARIENEKVSMVFYDFSIKSSKT